MAALQNTTVDFLVNGKTVSSQTLGDYYSTLVGSVGSDTSAASYQYSYQSTLASSLSDEKLAVSAVSLDEELTNLIMARLAAFEVTLGERDVCTLRADGVVVSTPTGSTAYCVSAGGPLIHPDLDVLCVVPICPFLSDFKPVVVPASDPVRLSLSAPETNMAPLSRKSVTCWRSIAIR